MAIVDKFKIFKEDGTSTRVSRSASVITPTNDTDLAISPRKIYVGGAGNINMRGIDDTANTLWTVPAGTTIEFTPRMIHATGTTATNIIAMF